MSHISPVFRRFVPQLLHVIVLPFFYFAFMLIYRPFGAISFFGAEWYGVHVTIIASIILICTVMTRSLYYFLPMKLNYALYIFWCLGEIIFMSFFTALYIWLVLKKPLPYFEVLAVSFQYVFLSLVIAYSLLALSLRLYEYHSNVLEVPDASVQRMRFYDEKHNLKLVLLRQALLYICAEINYVSIFYLDNDKVKTYVLRSSMKALDELCQEHGLVRCHRSFYVNPSHIKVLRKDKDGIVYAEMDAEDVRHIPVSKKFYDRLAEMLY